MKAFVLFSLLISNFAFAQEKGMVLSAKCSTPNDSKVFDIFIPEESDNFDSIKVGLKASIVEKSGVTPARIVSIKGSIINFKLDDGRTLKFNQEGGNKIRLGGTNYMCSNPIGF